MKKMLLFVTAILFASIAFAAEKPYYCIKFAKPEWGENHLGCQSCPVENNSGIILDCDAPGADPEKCCYGKPQGDLCTTDHLCGYLINPKCKEFFEGHLAYGHVYGSCSNSDARRNSDGGKGNVKPVKPKHIVKPVTPRSVKDKKTVAVDARKTVIKENKSK